MGCVGKEKCTLMDLNNGMISWWPCKLIFSFKLSEFNIKVTYFVSSSNLGIGPTHVYMPNRFSIRILHSSTLVQYLSQPVMSVYYGLLG